MEKENTKEKEKEHIERITTAKERTKEKAKMERITTKEVKEKENQKEKEKEEKARALDGVLIAKVLHMIPTTVGTKASRKE